MKASYQWLQTFFAEGALPDTETLTQKLIFQAYEIEDVETIGDDKVLDVDVLPNRSSDSLSQRGIAREISTLFDIPLAHDPLATPAKLTPTTNQLSVNVEKDSSCNYYSAALIQGITVGPSPEWLTKRLEAVGQRSINNIVDATNYILFELGQPLHAFDADKMSNHIVVRPAKDGETITLLGGEVRELTNAMTLITDGASDTPLAVAGVKGGEHAEVTASTTNIILEAANFDPTQTRKTAQALKLRTDASARYENEVPGPLTPIAMRELTELVLKVAGGECLGYQEAGDSTGTNSEVQVSVAQINNYLGSTLTKDTIAMILTRLAFTFTQDADVFFIVAPWYRRDITIPEEVIEEVGRVAGYDTLEAKLLPQMPEPPRPLPTFALIQKVRTTLIALGYTEVYLYSLRDTGVVKLANALASDKNHLRENLAAGLSRCLDKNEPNKPLLGIYGPLRIFEVGNVFPSMNTEEVHVALAVRVVGKKKREARTQTALLEAKEALEKALGARLPEPKGEVLEFSLSQLTEIVSIPEQYAYVGAPAAGIQFKPFSTYPFVLRDIALWVPEGTDETKITESIKQHGGALVQRIDKFDEFQKDGRTSLAFHIVFQSMEKTLTDDEVGEVMQAIEKDLSTQGFEVR